MATPTIDYGKLADQARGIDYSALADQARAGGGQPEQSFGEALREYGRKMGGMVTGISQAVSHPIETTKNWMAQNEQLAQMAEDAYHKGDYKGAARHATNYLINMIPGMGAGSDQAGTKLEQGDIAGGLADTAALGTQAVLGIKSPAIMEGAGKLTSATGVGLKTAAPGVVKGAGNILLGTGLGEAVPEIPGPMGSVLRYTVAGGPIFRGARQIGSALSKGFQAARESFSPPPIPPPRPPTPINDEAAMYAAQQARLNSQAAPPASPAKVVPISPAPTPPPTEPPAAAQPSVPVATRMANAARAVRAGSADTLAQGLQDTGISADMADTIPRFKWRDIARAHGVDWPASSEAQFNLIRDARAALRQRTTK